MKDVSAKWTRADSGQHYVQGRFSSARARGRDPRLVARLLREHGVRPARGGLLDMPCGTGRLGPVLAATGEPVTSVDVALPMLAALTAPPALVGEPRRVLASAERLPFADRSFDVVVCCRLLHHLHAPDDLRAIIRELVRVSSRLVIASFWDAGSLPAWRTRAGLKPSEGPLGRRARPRAEIARLFREAGAPPAGFAHSFRFLSQQAFVAARREDATR